MSVPAVRKTSELSETEYFKKQNAVVDDFLRGETDPGILAKRHGITRAAVVTMLDDMKAYWRSEKSFKEMGRERLHEMDRHYSLLIKDGHETIQELKDSGAWDKVSTALKTVADIESRRQDALQKAGMYDDSELLEIVAEAERKVDAITEFMTAFIKKHPELKGEIIEGLKRIEDPDRLPEPEDYVRGETV